MDNFPGDLPFSVMRLLTRPNDCGNMDYDDDLFESAVHGGVTLPANIGDMSPAITKLRLCSAVVLTG